MARFIRQFPASAGATGKISRRPWGAVSDNSQGPMLLWEFHLNSNHCSRMNGGSWPGFAARCRFFLWFDVQFGWPWKNPGILKLFLSFLLAPILLGSQSWSTEGILRRRSKLGRSHKPSSVLSLIKIWNWANVITRSGSHSAGKQNCGKMLANSLSRWPKQD